MEMPSLQAIQDHFNEIFRTANNLGGKFGNTSPNQAAAQAAAIQQCYGVAQAPNKNQLGYGCTPDPICNPAPCDPTCPRKGEGITSKNTSGGFNIRLYTEAECNKLRGNWAATGRSWGMPNNNVGECFGARINFGFCNNTKVSSPSADALNAINEP
jgi:hypothetical protein